MLIKERLERLTNGEVKKFVSDAVAAEKIKKSKSGSKLLEEYNKLYVEVLKFKRVYDVKMPEVESSVRATVGKDIDDAAFEVAEKSIFELRKQWAVIVATFRKFETIEAALKKEYALH